MHKICKILLCDRKPFEVCKGFLYINITHLRIGIDDIFTPRHDEASCDPLPPPHRHDLHLAMTRHCAIPLNHVVKRTTIKKLLLQNVLETVESDAAERMFQIQLPIGGIHAEVQNIKFTGESEPREEVASEKEMGRFQYIVD